MKSGKLLSFEFFPTLQNREAFFKKITSDENVFRRLTNQYLLQTIFAFAYGLVMGSYHSFYQALAAGVKVAVLFNLALIICFPAFFIIQFILGSKLRVTQMISIILSGFVLTTAIMVSFAPIIIIFLLTGGNYYFLQLLHIAIFVLSGFFGMKTVVDALRYSCEEKNVYPQTGVVVFRFWVVILAFVGIQLAWNLRPFLGDRGEGFTWFRDYEGNFYTALIYSAKQLVEGEEAPSKEPFSPAPASGSRPPSIADSIPPDSILYYLGKDEKDN